MDALLHRFPVSGVETWLFLPPLVMFLVASLTSMSGVTGAFVLLPFNMSVLGYTGPGVTATNFVYNIVAIPLGIWRYVRSGRLSRALLVVLVVGTLPGVFLGYLLRVMVMPNPRSFRPFVGAVLCFLAVRVFQSVFSELRARREGTLVAPSFGQEDRLQSRIRGRRIEIELGSERYGCSVLPVLSLSLVVGVVGGAYGIGGGAVMAPFCIAVMRLPPQVVAGATLLSTWVTSVLGALVYALVELPGRATVPPDWLLGGLYGLGGMAGVYVGARLQGRVPAVLIKGVLGVVLVLVGGRYLLGAFL